MALAVKPLLQKIGDKKWRALGAGFYAEGLSAKSALDALNYCIAEHKSRMDRLRRLGDLYDHLPKLFRATRDMYTDAGFMADLNESGIGFMVMHGKHPKDAYGDWSEFKKGYAPKKGK